MRTRWERDEKEARTRWGRDEDEMRTRWERDENETRTRRERDENEMRTRRARDENEMRTRWERDDPSEHTIRTTNTKGDGWGTLLMDLVTFLCSERINHGASTLNGKAVGSRWSLNSQSRSIFLFFGGENEFFIRKFPSNLTKMQECR
jgi:hypothetical protein